MEGWLLRSLKTIFLPQLWGEQAGPHCIIRDLSQNSLGWEFKTGSCNRVLHTPSISSHKLLHLSSSNSEGSCIWSHSFVDFCWVENGDKVLTVEQINLKFTMEPRLTSNWQTPPSLSLLGTEIPGLILAHSFLWWGNPAGVNIFSRSCYTALISRPPSSHIHWVISHLHHCCPHETSQNYHMM